MPAGVFVRVANLNGQRLTLGCSRVPDSQTWIKKELLIPNPQARAACLAVLSDAPIEALINGIAQDLGSSLRLFSVQKMRYE